MSKLIKNLLLLIAIYDSQWMEFLKRKNRWPETGKKCEPDISFDINENRILFKIESCDPKCRSWATLATICHFNLTPGADPVKSYIVACMAMQCCIKVIGSHRLLSDSTELTWKMSCAVMKKIAKQKSAFRPGPCCECFNCHMTFWPTTFFSFSTTPNASPRQGTWLTRPDPRP